MKNLLLATLITFFSIATVEAGSGSKYQSAQFIGFSIDTGPSGDTSQCQSIGKEQPCYMGSSDLAEDVTARARLMQKAVETAYAHADNSKKTLKVFIAPEFYWRGPDGAYPASSIFDPTEANQINPINMIGRFLEELVSDQKYKDWIFVFGTVIAINDMVPDDVLANAPGDQKLFYNFAPIYKGGRLRPGKMFIAPKRYISNIDFLANPVNAGEISQPREVDKYDSTAWNAIQDWLKVDKGYSLVQHNWLKVDQLQFSIEICLDHLNQQALQSAWEGYTKRGAQISLVTSAGMSPRRDSYVMSKGGHLFLQDGLNKSASYQVSRLGISYFTNDLINIIPSQPGLSTASCTEEPCAGQEFSVYKSPDEALAEIGQYYSNSTWPAVRVFDKVKIPRSQKLF